MVVVSESINVIGGSHIRGTLSVFLGQFIVEYDKRMRT